MHWIEQLDPSSARLIGLATHPSHSPPFTLSLTDHTHPQRHSSGRSHAGGGAHSHLYFYCISILSPISGHTHTHTPSSFTLTQVIHRRFILVSNPPSVRKAGFSRDAPSLALFACRERSRALVDRRDNPHQHSEGSELRLSAQVGPGEGEPVFLAPQV